MMDDGSVNAEPMWTPGKVIPIDAIKCVIEGNLLEINSATVDEFGQSITVDFPDGDVIGQLQVLPGHPGLVAANGMSCGGAYRSA